MPAPAAEVPDQRFTETYERTIGVLEKLPDQLLEIPSVGWVQASHVEGLTIGGMLDVGTEKSSLVMVLVYSGGIGDRAGPGFFSALTVDQARAMARGLERTCALIEARPDFDTLSRRPPAQEAR